MTGEPFDIADMQADHITPWFEGGPTTPENCRMLGPEAHKDVTARYVREKAARKNALQERVRKSNK